MADAKAERLEPAAPDFEEAVGTLQPWLRRHQGLGVGLLLSYEQPTFLQTAGLPEEYWGTPSVSISLQNEPLLRSDGGDSAAINFRHPALRRRFSTDGLRRLAARYTARDCDFEGGWFTVRGVVISESGLDADVLFESAEPLDGSPWSEEHETTCQSFVNLFNAIRLSTLRAIASILALETVSASRTVPERADVTYLMDSNGVELPATRLGLFPAGKPEFASLTASAFRAEMAREDETHLLHPDRAEPETASDRRLSAYAQALVNFVSAGYIDDGRLPLVNRLLREYVFRERGYCLAADVHELVALDRNGPRAVDSPLAAGGGRHRYLVSLVLRDSANRTFNFDEVGSGIGYVLPVLIRLASGERAYIQQPELHLHPALQAELADAFTARLNESEVETDVLGPKRLLQCVIETHSEHFLLRLLRRVRQGADQSKAADIHTLGREQLVVLYVEPSADGSSKVKHLRVSRDGDFIDRWPRGFFDERWKELFDE